MRCNGRVSNDGVFANCLTALENNLNISDTRTLPGQCDYHWLLYIADDPFLLKIWNRFLSKIYPV